MNAQHTRLARRRLAPANPCSLIARKNFGGTSRLLKWVSSAGRAGGWAKGVGYGSDVITGGEGMKGWGWGSQGEQGGSALQAVAGTQLQCMRRNKRRTSSRFCELVQLDATCALFHCDQKMDSLGDFNGFQLISLLIMVDHGSFAARPQFNSLFCQDFELQELVVQIRNSTAG